MPRSSRASRSSRSTPQRPADPPEPPETRELSRLMEMIANLGAASEVELQAKTLKPLEALHRDIESLEDRGLVKRREAFFRGGYGDALELTRKGYKSVRDSSTD